MKERRHCQRKSVHIKAEIISEETSYSVLIDNISERGISLETESANFLNRSTRFTPGNKYQIKFETPFGELLTINCKVAWSFKTGTHGIVRKVGLEVIFPSPSYIDYCNTP